MGESKTAHTSAQRLTALDGLRGIAALIVVVSHAMVTEPHLHAITTGEGVDGGPFWVWLLAHTPLHLLWAGTEAVFVFYLLSGFVLTLPFLRAKRPSWISYYPKRMVRLYLPALGAIAVALAATVLVPRIASDDLSAWVNSHSATPSPLRDALLVLGTGWLDTPLWSLKWEVLFSLLLPAYLFAALRIQRVWIIGIAGMFTLIWMAAATQHFGPMYLSMFAVGVVMAIQRDKLQEYGRRLGKSSWAAFIVVALLLLSARPLFPGLPGWYAFAALGAGGIVFAFIAHRPTMGLGELAPVRWLGTRSFSIYLIHEPIVVSVALVLHTANPFLVLALSLPVSLLVAEAFFRAIERPSHRLANATGKLLDRLQGKRAKALSYND